MDHRVRRSLGLAMCSLLAMIAIAACGQSTLGGSPTRLATAAPGNETLFVLDGGANGPQRIIAVHPGHAGGAPIVLPAGLATQDHQRMYSATPNGAETTISILATSSGATLHSFSIAGSYVTNTYGYGDATLTPDGHWLALRRVGHDAGIQSTIALVDTQAQKVAQTIRLGGDFDLDALSPDGSVLYLLQNLHDAEHHYYVRAYDLIAGRLLDQIIVDKTEIDHPQMQGSAVARRLGDSGEAAFTLYVDPLRTTAFVHVLPLNSAANIVPFARCVDDLPASNSADLLRGYTLVLANDGTTLYAVNAALGVASNITTLNGALNAQVVASGRFEPMGNASDIYGAGGILSNGAALSTDGKTLYIAGARGLQLIRTSDLQPLGTYLAGHVLSEVATSANGNLLYVIDAQLGVMLLSSDGSQSVQLAIQGAKAPMGIAWVDR